MARNGQHGSARDFAHMTDSTRIRGAGKIDLDTILEICIYIYMHIYIYIVFFLLHVSFVWGCNSMQENRVNQNRKGCNKHFKVAALSSLEVAFWSLTER